MRKLVICLVLLLLPAAAGAQEKANFDSGWTSFKLSEAYDFEYENEILKVNNFYIRQKEGFMSGRNEIEVGASAVNKTATKINVGIQVFCLEDKEPLFATSFAPSFDILSERTVETISESVASPSVNLETAVCNTRVVSGRT